MIWPSISLILLGMLAVVAHGQPQSALQQQKRSSKDKRQEMLKDKSLGFDWDNDLVSCAYIELKDEFGDGWGDDIYLEIKHENNTFNFFMKPEEGHSFGRDVNFCLESIEWSNVTTFRLRHTNSTDRDGEDTNDNNHDNLWDYSMGGWDAYPQYWEVSWSIDFCYTYNAFGDGNCLDNFLGGDAYYNQVNNGWYDLFGGVGSEVRIHLQPSYFTDMGGVTSVNGFSPYVSYDGMYDIGSMPVCEECRNPPKPKPRPRGGGNEVEANSTRRELFMDHRELDWSGDLTNCTNATFAYNNTNCTKARPTNEIAFNLTDINNDGWFDASQFWYHSILIDPDYYWWFWNPTILVYPKWRILDKSRKEVLHEGTLCGLKHEDVCGERIYKDGHMVFRVSGATSGFGSERYKERWHFCDTDGLVNEELIFKMKKGQCTPLLKLSYMDYHNGLGPAAGLDASIAVSMLLTGVTSADLTVKDLQLLEAAVMSGMKASAASVQSWELYDESSLLVSFTATVNSNSMGLVVSMDELTSMGKSMEEAVALPFADSVMMGSLRASTSSLARSDVLSAITAVELVEAEVVTMNFATSTNPQLSSGQAGTGSASAMQAAAELDAQAEVQQAQRVVYAAGALAVMALIVAVVMGVSLAKRVSVSPEEEVDASSSMEESSSHPLVARAGDAAAQMSEMKILRPTI